MYRRTLVLLWGGVGVFAALAVTDAMIDFMGHMQGLWIGATMTCALCAGLHVWFNRLNQTAIVNRERSEQLQASVDEKTKQVRSDVDQIRCQMNDLKDEVGEAREWAEAAALVTGSKKKPKESEPEPEQEPCPIYQLRIRDGRREAIVGRRTPDPIDPAEVWPLFRDGETGTLPGSSAS